jgi:predicted GNAT superfamily acetyltransferase
MATFINLSGTRYNVGHIVDYSAHASGGSYVVVSVMTDRDAVADHVTETPEQIDKMVGVMADADKALRDAVSDFFRAFDRGYVNVSMPHETEDHHMICVRSALDAARGE